MLKEQKLECDIIPNLFSIFNDIFSICKKEVFIPFLLVVVNLLLRRSTP